MPFALYTAAAACPVLLHCNAAACDRALHLSRLPLPRGCLVACSPAPTIRLAVEVAYPADENSIEALQQLCGNLFSALLVPIAARAGEASVRLPLGGDAAAVRGDYVLLGFIALVGCGYYAATSAPLTPRSSVLRSTATPMTLASWSTIATSTRASSFTTTTKRESSSPPARSFSRSSRLPVPLLPLISDYGDRVVIESSDRFIGADAAPGRRPRYPLRSGVGPCA